MPEYRNTRKTSRSISFKEYIEAQLNSKPVFSTNQGKSKDPVYENGNKETKDSTTTLEGSRLGSSPRYSYSSKSFSSSSLSPFKEHLTNVMCLFPQVRTMKGSTRFILTKHPDHKELDNPTTQPRQPQATTHTDVEVSLNFFLDSWFFFFLYI